MQQRDEINEVQLQDLLLCCLLFLFAPPVSEQAHEERNACIAENRIYHADQCAKAEKACRTAHRKHQHEREPVMGGELRPLKLQLRLQCDQTAERSDDHCQQHQNPVDDLKQGMDDGGHVVHGQLIVPRFGKHHKRCDHAPRHQCQKDSAAAETAAQRALIPDQRGKRHHDRNGSEQVVGGVGQRAHAPVGEQPADAAGSRRRDSAVFEQYQQRDHNRADRDHRDHQTERSDKTLKSEQRKQQNDRGNHDGRKHDVEPQQLCQDRGGAGGHNHDHAKEEQILHPIYHGAQPGTVAGREKIADVFPSGGAHQTDERGVDKVKHRDRHEKTEKAKRTEAGEKLPDLLTGDKAGA